MNQNDIGMSLGRLIILPDSETPPFLKWHTGYEKRGVFLDRGPKLFHWSNLSRLWLSFAFMKYRRQLFPSQYKWKEVESSLEPPLNSLFYTYIKIVPTNLFAF